MARSIQQRLAETQQRPSGFDYMRLVLALGVICSHSVLLTGNDWIYHMPVWTILGLIVSWIVPMFFALSGFLVAGSFERCATLIRFLGLRILRIMPALSVEVVVSAIILGPLFTSLNLREYYQSAIFHRYFFNLIGHIQYVLPGVFESNPNSLVNGQLWTVPFELVCYVAFALLAIFGAYKRPKLLLLVLVGCYVFQAGNTFLRPNYEYRGAAGTTTVMMFICGLSIFRFRERIPWSFWLALLCAGVSIWLCSIPNGIRFSGMPMAYLTVYLGLLNPPRNRVIFSGDYSYGLYLYGYPIQQAVVNESLSSMPFMTWYWNLLFSIPLCVCVASFSWWFVERPCLRLRVLIDQLEARWLSGSLSAAPESTR